RFLPDQTEEENISSKEFLKKANFIDVATLAKGAEVETEETGTDDNGGTEIDDNEGDNNGNGGNTGGNTGGGGLPGSGGEG
ncbi:MAG: hypothetical protein IKP41_08500, partial [Bacteroidaceae bacterium]|nr:hypothetical protein [Bacteroidaceae bacterium]